VSYVLDHWSFDPFLVIAAVVVVVHELGLRRLAARSHPRRTRRRRRRSFVFYSGLGVVLAAVDSPIYYWSFRYFYIHMIEHILVMFFAPVLVAVGAPWVPLLNALPDGVRRKLGRALTLGHGAAPLRRLWRWVSAPWTALVLFNAAMVAWHVPAALDLAERNRFVHTWCMLPCFLFTGLLFWLQIVPSRPFHRRASAAWQMGAIISSNVVMFILAMALSILTNHSWYTAYAHVPGVSLSPFADQQIGAAILWVCGDFWAIPALAWVVRQAITEQGSLSGILESIMWRSASGRSAGHLALTDVRVVRPGVVEGLPPAASVAGTSADGGRLNGGGHAET
jgi:putative membrane protein